MRKRWIAVIAAVCGLAPAPLASLTLSCKGIPVTVTADDSSLAAQTCIATQSVLARLSQCHVRLRQPVKIEIVTDLPSSCLGLYHCGENHIEVLSPEAALATRTEDSVFSPLTKQEFFASILAHELTHAAYDATPCPFGDCAATAEYLAYAMQIMTLPPDKRDEIETGFEITRTISRDEINPMILYMAPDVFIRKSWGHLTQRENSCAYVKQIMEGKILFDSEHP